jgi:type I restriction enzyme S subunit
MTSHLDLPLHYREQLDTLLCEHVPGIEVWAYGSRVNGRSHDGSDLDLVLRIPTLEPLGHEYFELVEALEQSNIPILVQAHDWARLPESFHREIERDYVVLGGMRNDWRETIYGVFPVDFIEESLANLCDRVDGIQTGPFGSQLHQRDYVPIGTPIITVEHLGDNRIIHQAIPRVSDYDSQRLSKYSLRGGDIVFSRVGSVDRRSLVREEEDGWLFSGRCLRVRPNQEIIDPGYLSYFFGLPAFREHIRAVAVGVTMPSLNTRILADVTVLLPPLSEQRAIAGILGALDDKIELNRRMNETLEQMARALFQSWFVDFDPVRAKMAGREPNLPPGLWDLFPDRLVDSELGEIPEGWEVKTLGDVVNLNPESWSRTNMPADVEYVDLANTKWGLIESTQHFLWKDAPSRARRVLHPGDTIVGTVRPGNGSYSFIGKDGLTGSTGFAVLRPVHSRFQELVYLSATAPDNIEWLAHRADGAAYPAVRPEIVSETEIAIPADESKVLDRFSEIVGTILDKMESAKQETRSLAVQRDALLPRLVSGEVRLDLSFVKR